MPNPAADLLDQGEQLARFIARQQRADGSLVCSDLMQKPSEADVLPASQSLMGLIRSQSLRPGAWKMDVMRKAVAYYRPWWREHRNLASAAGFCSSFAEAFLQTNDRAGDIALAEFACELADYLCAQQLEKLDPQHPLWRGGFPESTSTAPSIGSMNCGTAIVAAARVCRQLPDADRFARYRDAAVLALQFASTLQFTEANTQQFNGAYRQQYLLGGFHQSHEDGRLPLEGSSRAVSAMLAYLSGIADL
jgi:hypothetical protein